MSNAIVRKLKLEKYPRKLMLNKPIEVNEFSEFEFEDSEKGKFDAILAFIFSIEEFVTLARKVIANDSLNEQGYIFFFYPKLKNKKYPGISSQLFIPSVDMDTEGYIDGSEVKFCKMVSFNETFTVIGLKKQKRKTKKS